MFATLAVLVLGVGIFLSPAQPQETPDALKAQIYQATRIRQWDQAETLIDQLAELIPGDSSPILLRAELERDRGRPDAALSMLATIQDTDPRAATARLFAGQIERDNNRLGRAEALYREALAIDPGHLQVRRELIFLLGMQARREELIEQFRELAARTSLSAQQMMLWTAVHENIWANTAVQKNLEDFVAADPEDRRSRLALAEVLQRAGQVDESEIVLEPLPDEDVEARVLRARLALDRGRIEEAASWLAEGPTQHAALARLRGQLALRRGQPAEAAEAFRISAAQEPTDRETLQGLALALTLLGRPQEAIPFTDQAGRLRDLATLLQKARTRSGQADRALPKQLGAACEALGLRDEARGWYRIVLAADPLDTEAQQALYRLREEPTTGTSVKSL